MPAFSKCGRTKRTIANDTHAGITLVELLVGISVTAITLPLLLNLMLEPLLAQLRTGALAEATGQARLLALKARQSSTVTWNPQANSLVFDGQAMQLPEGCSVTGTTNLSVSCSSGASSSVSHTSAMPLITRNPCDSELFPMQANHPDNAAVQELIERCRQGLGG